MASSESHETAIKKHRAENPGALGIHGGIHRTHFSSSFSETRKFLILVAPDCFLPAFPV